MFRFSLLTYRKVKWVRNKMACCKVNVANFVSKSANIAEQKINISALVYWRNNIILFGETELKQQKTRLANVV